jgi:hypothetical protein
LGPLDPTFQDITVGRHALRIFERLGEVSRRQLCDLRQRFIGNLLTKVYCDVILNATQGFLRGVRMPGAQ